MIRRTFLKIAGTTALALPAMSCARVGAPSTKRQEFIMDIKRAGTQPSSKGPPEWFTGAVRIAPLFKAPPPARAIGSFATSDNTCPNCQYGYQSSCVNGFPHDLSVREAMNPRASQGESPGGPVPFSRSGWVSSYSAKARRAGS